MQQSKQLAAAVAVLSLLLVASSALADTKRPFRRVRPLDSMVGALIVRGYAGSFAFRRLVDAIERSDVIVHVESGKR